VHFKWPKRTMGKYLDIEAKRGNKSTLAIKPR
jgi:hypothetical protein